MSTKRKTPAQPGNMKTGGFRTEAERDSGFSDASSEHFSTMDTTDSEDSPGPVQPGSQTPGSKGTSSNPGAQLTVVGGSYSNLSSMIIMNNVVLKQPSDPPPALKPWRFSPAVEVVQPMVQQPQVVFLQPVVSRQTPSTSSKTSNKHRRSKKYLPILKSYPKIAPRDSSRSSSSSSRGTASSVSSGSSSTLDRSSQSDRSAKEKSQRSHGNGVQNASSNLPPTLSAVSPMLQNQLSLPSTETSSSGVSKDNQTGLARSSELAPQPPLPFNPGKQAHRPDQEVSVSGAQLDSEGDDDVRRKRFCNTYNILSKSGLLDITLRTKELLRQNKRTQSDIEHLKEQTDQFLQALRSGDSSICVKLQASLQEEDKEREREKREVKTD